MIQIATEAETTKAFAHFVMLTSELYKVGFSKVFFAKISLGMTYIVLRSNTFEKNSERRTFS